MIYGFPIVLLEEDTDDDDDDIVRTTRAIVSFYGSSEFPYVSRPSVSSNPSVFLLEGLESIDIHVTNLGAVSGLLGSEFRCRF